MQVPNTCGACGHSARASSPIEHICPTANASPTPSAPSVARMAAGSPKGVKSRLSMGSSAVPSASWMAAAVSRARR